MDAKKQYIWRQVLLGKHPHQSGVRVWFSEQGEAADCASSNHTAADTIFSRAEHTEARPRRVEAAPASSAQPVCQQADLQPSGHEPPDARRSVPSDLFTRRLDEEELDAEDFLGCGPEMHFSGAQCSSSSTLAAPGSLAERPPSGEEAPVEPSSSSVEGGGVSGAPNPGAPSPGVHEGLTSRTATLQRVVEGLRDEDDAAPSRCPFCWPRKRLRLNRPCPGFHFSHVVRVWSRVSNAPPFLCSCAAGEAPSPTRGLDTGAECSAALSVARPGLCLQLSLSGPAGSWCRFLSVQLLEAAPPGLVSAAQCCPWHRGRCPRVKKIGQSAGPPSF